MARRVKACGSWVLPRVLLQAHVPLAAASQEGGDEEEERPLHSSSHSLDYVQVRVEGTPRRTRRGGGAAAGSDPVGRVRAVQGATGACSGRHRHGQRDGGQDPPTPALPWAWEGAPQSVTETPRSAVTPSSERCGYGTAWAALPATDLATASTSHRGPEGVRRQAG